MGEMTISWPEWPMLLSDQAVFVCAAITVLFGIFMLFLPATSLRILRLRPADNHPEAVGEARAMSGFYLAMGLCVILLMGLPFLYLIFAAAWLLTAFGRAVSMLSDRGNTLYNWIALLIELALGLVPLAAALDFFPGPEIGTAADATNLPGQPVGQIVAVLTSVC